MHQTAGVFPGLVRNGKNRFQVITVEKTCRTILMRQMLWQKNHTLMQRGWVQLVTAMGVIRFSIWLAFMKEDLKLLFPIAVYSISKVNMEQRRKSGFQIKIMEALTGRIFQAINTHLISWLINGQPLF